MTKTYDPIIIGAGRAVPFLAQRLAGAGMKVAIIERKLRSYERGNPYVSGPKRLRE